jgi:oligopeptide transport system substrate-binding protein
MKWRMGVSVAVLLALVACGNSDQHASDRLTMDAVAARVAAGHLQVHLSQAPRTIDPGFCEDVPGFVVLGDLFEGLMRLDAAGNVEPGVAERWEVSADGLRWRFHLRTTARWSNGDVVTSQDFVFAWRRVVDPVNASQLAQQFEPIAGAPEIIAGRQSPTTLGVSAPDALTLDVTLTSPVAYFPYLLTNSWMAPVHASTLAQHGIAWTQAGKMVSNGPFLLQARVINGPITAKPNPQYWDAGGVRLQGVTYHPVPDTAVATARYLAGDLDLTDRIQVGDFSWLRESLGAEVHLAPYFGNYMLHMHVGRPPFNNQNLRRAMAMAVDREILMGKLLKGIFLPANGLVPPLPGYPSVQPDWAAMSDEVRHAEARRLYAAAGYSAAHPLDVELWYMTTDADTRRVLEALSAMWRINLGANVRLANEEWRVFQQNRRLRKHDLFFNAWIGDYPDPLTFLDLFTGSSPQNHTTFDDADYEQWVRTARRETDVAARNALYNQAERRLNETAPLIPVYFYQSRHLLRNYVQGWHDNPMDRHPSRTLYLAMPAGRALPVTH